MKPILLLLLCSLVAFAQDVVFRGVPKVRVLTTIEGEERQNLEGDSAQKNECRIVLRGKKYFWASRDNAPLRRVDGQQFTYFIHDGGSGYVKIFTGSREDANKGPADYVESVSQGFTVVTYWGRSSTAMNETAE